jgi:predicted transcriptional regulator
MTDDDDSPTDILSRLKQLTAPIVESLDARLGGQIDRRVDERVEEILRDRLAVIERAIADLDRSLRELREHDAG